MTDYTNLADTMTDIFGDASLCSWGPSSIFGFSYEQVSEDTWVLAALTQSKVGGWLLPGWLSAVSCLSAAFFFFQILAGLVWAGRQLKIKNCCFVAVYRLCIWESTTCPAPSRCVRCPLAWRRRWWSAA